MRVDTEHHLRRAAECILMAVECSDPDEQETMLNLAQSWLQQSEVTRNADQHQPDSHPAVDWRHANPAHLIERALDEARARQFT
jgi:hypothetical protein